MGSISIRSKPTFSISCLMRSTAEALSGAWAWKVAGATGFAPLKSIIEDAFHRGIARPMRLYWGVRDPDDLYMRELLDPSELQRRMELYVRNEESAERLPKRSFAVLREALLAGELELIQAHLAGLLARVFPPEGDAEPHHGDDQPWP